MVSKFDVLFDRWVDIKGINFVECKIVVVLFFWVIDVVKIGERVRIFDYILNVFVKNDSSDSFVW